MKYDVSIIGAGRIGSDYDEIGQNLILTHAHAICKHTSFNLKGFYDIDETKRRNASEKWGGRAFDTLDEALGDADIVCVSAPDKIHVEIVENAIQKENVKAIICEKPYASTLEEAYRITDLIKHSNKPFLLNYSRRYMREFYDLKNWITEYAGSLICGDCFYGKGILHNGSHFLDLIRFLLGEYTLDHVFGKIYDYSESDQSIELVLKEAKGFGKIYFHAIDCRLVTLFEMDLLFERGRIRYSDESGSIEYYCVGGGDSPYKEVNFCLDQVVSIDRNNAMMGLYDNLIGVLENSGKPQCGHDEGLALMRLIDEIRKE